MPSYLGSCESSILLLLARQAYYVILILFMLSYHIAHVTESITLPHPFITVESEAMDVLNRAVTLSTQKCYSRVEGQWLGFISSRFSAVDPWFNDVSQRCKRVVLITFIKYMSSNNHSIVQFFHCYGRPATAISCSTCGLEYL